MKQFPTRQEAWGYLDKANVMNPGPWYHHSINAAHAAENIARKCGSMNPDRAYVQALLHDIGRREGKGHLKHTLDGYKFMMKEGYGAIARTCLTHSFPSKNFYEYAGQYDLTIEEQSFIELYINKIDYDDYDRIVQLCDALANAEGFCLVEKRLMETGIRLGVNEHILKKWQSYLGLVEYFTEKAGTSIYHFLPGVIDNTFMFNRNRE